MHPRVNPHSLAHCLLREPYLRVRATPKDYKSQGRSQGMVVDSATSEEDYFKDR